MKDKDQLRLEAFTHLLLFTQTSFHIFLSGRWLKVQIGMIWFEWHTPGQASKNFLREQQQKILSGNLTYRLLEPAGFSEVISWCVNSKVIEIREVVQKRLLFGQPA